MERSVCSLIKAQRFKDKDFFKISSQIAPFLYIKSSYTAISHLYAVYNLGGVSVFYPLTMPSRGIKAPNPIVLVSLINPQNAQGEGSPRNPRTTRSYYSPRPSTVTEEKVRGERQETITASPSAHDSSPSKDTPHAQSAFGLDPRSARRGNHSSWARSDIRRVHCPH
jgi:hypothetical protein